MIIIYKKPGRLANSLWLYAHFIAFSAENNIALCFPALMDYGDYFKSTHSTLLYSFPKQKSFLFFNFLRQFILKSIPYLIRFSLKFKLNFTEYIFLKYEHEFNLEDIQNYKRLNKKIVFVEGWLFRSNNLILKHKDKIIDFFEPLELYKQNINKLISECRKDCDILIGMHIRREDYKIAFNGIYYFEIADYKRKMEEIEKLLINKKVCFLICSNETINKEDFSGLNIFIGTNHIIEDFYSLAKCDYIVGVPSTFSMWASYYGSVPLYQIKEIKHSIIMDEFEIITN